MKKKISLILVAMMCILMVGCKNKDNDIPTNTKTPAKVEKVVEKPVVNKQESAKETSTEMLETILENIQSSNETFSWNKTLKIKDNDNKIQYIEVSINENDTENTVLANIVIDYNEMTATCECDYKINKEDTSYEEKINYEVSTDGIEKAGENSIPEDIRNGYESIINQIIYTAFH